MGRLCFSNLEASSGLRVEKVLTKLKQDAAYIVSIILLVIVHRFIGKYFARLYKAKHNIYSPFDDHLVIM